MQGNNRKTSTRVSLRLPNDIAERIEGLRKGDEPRSAIIIEALRIGLDKMSQQKLI